MIDVKHRTLLICLGGISALLATLMLCGYLVTVRFDISITPGGQSMGIAADFENGRMLIDAGARRYLMGFGLTQKPGWIDYHFKVESNFVSVNKPYWWGWDYRVDHHGSGLPIGPSAGFVAPIWSVALPATLFPLIYFGRKLQNRAGGFPVIAQAKEA